MLAPGAYQVSEYRRGDVLSSPGHEDKTTVKTTADELQQRYR